MNLGRFRILGPLGQGGMAEVYLARAIDSAVKQPVAIKRILPHLAGDPEIVRMFHTEGRIAVGLAHPNVCHVHELGADGDELFLAMELLRGLPWSEILPAVPDQPVASLVRFVAGVIVQACEGLHHAHASAVVHRDVSPANLFVTTDGTVKLLDFGIARVLTEASATRPGLLKGKLPYMAPEQLRNQPVDARTDLFALGIVTWEALAGRSLFARDSDFETIEAVHAQPIQALPIEHPVGARIDEVLRRVLARDRSARQATALVFAGELREATAPLGPPMVAGEIAAHLATWLAPSLARRARELAELLGRPLPDEPPDPDTTGEQTSQFTPAREVGVRVRDVAVVVGPEAAATTEYVARRSPPPEVATAPGEITAPRSRVPFGAHPPRTVRAEPLIAPKLVVAAIASVVLFVLIALLVARM